MREKPGFWTRIREVGTHGELMAADGLYARMFRLQASSYVGNADR